MKTIKVPDKVHQELKRYVADNPKEKMEAVAGFSIMTYLKSVGHKFNIEKSKTKCKSVK